MGRLALSFPNTCHTEPHFSGRRMSTVVFRAMRGYVCSVPLRRQAANVSKCHIHTLPNMFIEHLENKGQNYVASAEYFRNVRRVEKMGIPSASDQEELNCRLQGQHAPRRRLLRAVLSCLLLCAYCLLRSATSRTHLRQLRACGGCN